MSRLLAIPFFAAMLTAAHAQPLNFDYKDPKEISAVSLTLDSMLEPIVGYAKGLSGTIRFDPEHPEATTGTVAVDVSSVKFAHDGYTQTAQNYALNGQKWPQLTLSIRKVESGRKVSATRFEGIVLADFTCRGITKPKRLEVTADYHPGRAEERTNGAHTGDLLILRTHFTVSRKEHGISDGIPDELVGDNIEVGVAVVGMHYTDKAEVAAPTEKPTDAPRKIEKAAMDQPVTLDASLAKLSPGAPDTLGEVKKGRSLVLFFFNEQCGVTHFYKARLQKLMKDSKGFAFAGVRCGLRQDPNGAIPETKMLAMPFYDDARGDLLQRFEIGQSLTFAVLDGAGNLRYLGGFDDNVNEKNAKHTYLRDAMRAVSSGKPVAVKRGVTMGCAILPPKL